eukprot:scaffold59470_cov36-Cyclotella_meneghiniana.AAC.3
MQTSASAAGLSQCIITDILNDAMQFGLECFAREGLCFLGFELWECEKVWLRPQPNKKAKSVTMSLDWIALPARVFAFLVLIALWEWKKSGCGPNQTKANLDWNALPARVSVFRALSSGSVATEKQSIVNVDEDDGDANSEEKVDPEPLGHVGYKFEKIFYGTD